MRRSQCYETPVPDDTVECSQHQLANGALRKAGKGIHYLAADTMLPVTINVLT